MQAENSQSDKLEQRHTSEANFSNLVYQHKQRGPKHYNLNPTAVIYERMKVLAGDLAGKHVLEYGCGTGWITFDLASREAILESFDISPVAVERTKEMLKRHNLDRNSQIRVMSAERLDYPDDFFDIVIGFAILHHLDLNCAIPELHRVMKCGGLAIFAEPLGSNPMLKLYRRMTPQYRTPDETPIIMDLFFKHVTPFRSFIHEESYLTALLSLMLVYIPFLKKYYRVSHGVLMQLDKVLLNAFPTLGKWAWYSIFTLRK